MTNNEPDWVIQSTDAGSQRLTDGQERLLSDIEEKLLNLGRAPQDVSELVDRVGPTVRALLESGLSPRQIADNSRLRPQFIELIIEGGTDVA